jgi:flavin reductase (DIM6/NTAB) family NADH-FMN oxidoreductase RutF
VGRPGGSVTALRHHEPAARPGRVTDDTFRGVFRDHAARVVVVTAAGAAPSAAPVGFTATSLASVSLRPPMVSFAVSRTASAWPTVASSDRVAVHLLADHQDDVATRFATSGIDRFEGIEWSRGAHGEPLLSGCGAYLCCRVVQHVPAGDHVVVLARVDEALLSATGAPLIYHDGGYASVAQTLTHSEPPRLTAVPVTTREHEGATP